MMMHMSFFWGKDVVVLFAGWPGGSGGMYILALAAVFLLAVAAEFLSATPSLKPRSLSRPMAGALINAAVYGVRMALAYLIMLSVMSFNVGVFAAAVAGHAAGRFVAKYKELAAVAPAADY
ncbi:copper transporter 6 [Phtheirospermum japonicum]|uniref:Copper transport protein n=1 Tax=Phtheirospermum japonicum TaxID=374723 RepID=A0A830D3D4_9LAMI|nr:copper transporter 6 [Phtheirospermum japonicum]